MSKPNISAAETLQTAPVSLTEGLVLQRGKPTRVASSQITKPNHREQLSEIMDLSMNIISNNERNRGIKSGSKQRFSIHRSVAFLPQE